MGVLSRGLYRSEDTFGYVLDHKCWCGGNTETVSDQSVRSHYLTNKSNNNKTSCLFALAVNIPVKTSCSLGNGAEIGFRPRRWTMNEVTATAVCDMFDAEQENNTITLKKKRVRVVRHLITACPVRKRATLETLPTTTQIIYRNIHPQKKGEQKSLTYRCRNHSEPHKK